MTHYDTGMVLAASDHLPGENLEFEIGHFLFHNYFLCSENNKTFLLTWIQQQKIFTAWVRPFNAWIDCLKYKYTIAFLDYLCSS